VYWRKLVSKAWFRTVTTITQSEDLTEMWDKKPTPEPIFWRICAASDDFGRMVYNPRLLRSQLMPLSTRKDQVFVDCVDELLGRDMLRRYEARGKQYLQVTNYSLYQEDQGWSRMKADCPPPADWAPPAALVAFLNTTTDQVKFRPERYGLESNGDGRYQVVPDRTAPCRSVSTAQHSTAPHKAQDTAEKASAPPPADAPPASPPIPKQESEQQKAIRSAWEAHDLGPLPHNPKGYSGLTALVSKHGCPRALEWAEHVRAQPESPPEGAADWPWFCERFRAAMNRPWEWDGSRGNGGNGSSGGKPLPGGRIPASAPEDFHSGVVTGW
jgi:hypothetical protein